MKRRYKDKPITESTLLFVVCIALLPVDQEAADAVNANASVPLSAAVGGGNAEEKKNESGAGYVDGDID